MDVPAPAAGTVASLAVAVGDKVSQGSLILTLEPASGDGAGPGRVEEDAAPPPAPPPEPEPAGDRVDLLVLGSGVGGYSAAFRAADLGLKVVLVERYATLGGVCLNVGCIPSKALLHVARVLAEGEEAASLGVRFGEPEIDVDGVRSFKEGVVKRLTGGLAQMAKGRGVEVVQGVGRFAGPHTLEVDGETYEFAHAVIAAGSQAAALPGLPDDPRIVDSTGALELRRDPRAAAGHRRRHHRPRAGDGVRRARLARDRRRDARPADDGRRPGRRQAAPEADQGPLRGDPPRRARRGGAGDRRRARGELRRRGGDLRPHPRRGRPAPERQRDRRRARRRERRRARLHPRRPPDAHERAAHLRDRRHRGGADAGPQGEPRGQGGRRGDRRPRRRVRRPHDPERRLHGPRGRVDGADRDAGEGGRHRGRDRGVPVGGLRPRARHRPPRGDDEADLRARHEAPARAPGSPASTPAS